MIMNNLIPIEKLKGFLERNYLKNRTIVSNDISSLIDDFEKTLGLPVKRHLYATGNEYGTWIIPPSWNVKEAYLKDSTGRLISSYEKHPLFLCPYSCDIDIKINKKELLEHVTVSEKQPDAYSYNWRYAMDARLRLKDWGISLPSDLINDMSDDEVYHLVIDTDVFDSNMIIADVFVKGESDETFIFVADYCHPGQVNDSFTGILLFMLVIKELSMKEKLKYSYRFLVLPETIGSVVYVADNQNMLDSIFGTMFSEMVGWGKKWYLKNTREGNTYIDKLAFECCKKYPDLNNSEFFSIFGNDEYIFDSVQVGIPSLSLQKHPYDEYHTSNDEPSKLDYQQLLYAKEIVMYFVDVLENDCIYEFTNPVPFWMTRYDLFADDEYDPEGFTKRFNIVYRYLDGERSILDIADKLGTDFFDIKPFLDKMLEHKLIRKKSKPIQK